MLLYLVHSIASYYQLLFFRPFSWLCQLKLIEKIIIDWPGDDPEEHSNAGINQFYIATQGISGLKEWKTKSSNNELPPSKPSNIAPDSTARIVLSSRLSLPPIYINSNGIEEELDREDLKGPLLLNLWTRILKNKGIRAKQSIN